MKELLNFITTATDKVKGSANARLALYLLVAAALLAAFLLLPGQELGFIYNDF